MIDSEETKRRKARELRYRKPVVRDINLDFIREELYEITEECENVAWYFDDDDTLLNALDGNDDEEYEFKMMFGDLCAECEQMSIDLANEYIPEYFDAFFVSIGAGEYGGGLLGYDSYEQDYFSLACTDEFAEQESAKKLKKLTKDQLIEGARYCFKVYCSYLGIRYRYDCLKASMDILRDQNTEYLESVKQVEEAYEKAEQDGFLYYEESTKYFERLISRMPQEAWVQ